MSVTSVGRTVAYVRDVDVPKDLSMRASVSKKLEVSQPRGSARSRIGLENDGNECLSITLLSKKGFMRKSSVSSEHECIVLSDELKDVKLLVHGLVNLATYIEKIFFSHLSRQLKRRWAGWYIKKHLTKVNCCFFHITKLFNYIVKIVGSKHTKPKKFGSNCGHGAEIIIDKAVLNVFLFNAMCVIDMIEKMLALPKHKEALDLDIDEFNNMKHSVLDIFCKLATDNTDTEEVDTDNTTLLPKKKKPYKIEALVLSKNENYVGTYSGNTFLDGDRAGPLAFYKQFNNLNEKWNKVKEDPASYFFTPETT